MLSEYLKPGALVLLSGELGAGKTTFVQGMAGGFGIKGFIRSSSFVIVNEYKGKIAKLYHIDLYRLGKKDLNNIGLDEYLNSDGVCVIEWAQNMQVNGLHKYWAVEITWEGEKNRKIKVNYIK